MPTAPFLSIIIPALNEERRLPKSLEQVCAFVGAQTYAADVWVVDNGSVDRTLATAQDIARSFPFLHILEEPERGKGAAVRRGMLAARGEWRFMCDADLSMPITETNRFLPPVVNGFDVVIASREAKEAVRYNEPEFRHLGGRFINLLIRLLAMPGLQDTQCGFKCFHTPAAEDLFNHQTVTGWSFDVELLVMARRRGYRIHELSVPWYYDPDSRLHPVQDTLRVVRDVWHIRRKARGGWYDEPQP